MPPPPVRASQCILSGPAGNVGKNVGRRMFPGAMLAEQRFSTGGGDAPQPLGTLGKVWRHLLVTAEVGGACTPKRAAGRRLVVMDCRTQVHT